MSQLWGAATQLPTYSVDPALQQGQASTDMFKLLQTYAPQAITAINQQVPQTAQAQLSAQEAVQPGYDALAAQEVANADKYQQELDPQFYAQRGAISDALTKYLSAYNPTTLSPTEVAQISRGINATTGPMAPSAVNTIKNAQTFGNAATQRWQNFGQAVTNAANVLPALKSGISGFQVANTGTGATAANTAASQGLSSNFGFSTSALGDIAGNEQAQIQKAKDAWDKIKAGSPSSVLGGIL